MCGADSYVKPAVEFYEGSSPRVRGRPPRSAASSQQSGLIPACAGQTNGVQIKLLEPPGSSPRVRGRLDLPPVDQLSPRLIPACAGQTSRGSPPILSSRAHPRVCGADPTLRQMASMSTGSSPRVRGRQGFRWGDQCRAGLIPACAGQTARRRAFPGWCRAHPRVCGADKPGCKAGQSPSGSSPRVRGRRCRQLVLADRGGLIPACAGQTDVTYQKGDLIGAHPRVCGADGQA